LLLRDPIRDHVKRSVTLRRVISFDVNAKAMFSAHVAMHHELHREFRRLSGIESHRTDDWVGWSAPLKDFDVGFFANHQWLIAGVRQHESGFHCIPELDFPQINDISVRFRFRRTGYLRGDFGVATGNAAASGD
jgi:hypothetical protein